jgi:hypothetical protein
MHSFVNFGVSHAWGWRMTENAKISRMNAAKRCRLTRREVGKGKCCSRHHNMSEVKSFWAHEEDG